jgi:4-amino-4-deoxy-L-arabinose transferase-like glycosyltransferase
VPGIERYWRLIGTPRAAMGCLVVLLLLIVGTTYARYGFGFDDLNGLTRAQHVLDFLGSGGADRAHVGRFTVFNFYGTMPDLLALLLQKILPFLGLDARHLVGGLFGVVGIYYAYRLGDLLDGGWTGPLAALLLACNPMWFGYMFIDLKDVPFAAALLAGSYHALRVLGDPAPSWRCWVGVGAWTGLLATTKLLGLPMLGVTTAILLGFVLAERRQADPLLLARRAAWGAAAAILGVLVCCALFWPQLFLYGPGQLWAVIQTFLDFTPWQGTVLLDGAVYQWDQVPRTYLITYFLIAMPLAITALYLAAGPLAVWRGRLALLGPVAIPLFFFILQAALHSQVYNGFRHIIFAIPFWSIAAASAVTMLVKLGRRPVAGLAATGLLALFVATSAYGIATVFPYQYSSYNLLVGGLAGAQGNFYVDVWRTAHREALRRLAAAVPPDATTRVYSCGSPLNFADLPRLQPVDDLAQADYVVALRRGCPRAIFAGYRILAEVRRGDVVFASVLAPQ